MTGLDEPTRGDRRPWIEADEISGFNPELPRIVGRPHRLIKPDLHRGLITFQFSKLRSVDVGRSFGSHDRAGDLAGPTSGVDRAVLPLDRRPVVATDARQLQPAVVLDLLDHRAESVDVRRKRPACALR